MTRDDVIRMARENGIVVIGEAVLKLCALVTAAEREACAKVCDVEASAIVTNASEQYQEGRSMGATVCANAIRARGEKQPR